MRADTRLPLLLLLVCLGSAAAPAQRGHADEAPVAPPRPPEPPGTYAGKDAAWWIRELRDPEMHKGALQALQLVGHDAADALIRALDDEDPAVRTALAGLLRRLTPPATIPSDVLARRLAVEEHESAIHGLLLLAPQATPTRPLVEGLLRHVGSDNPRVRQAACTVLGGLRLEAQHVPPALPQLAVEGDLAQATAALRVLAALPGTRALLEQAGLALLGREQEPDMRLVQEAMQLLLRAGLRSKGLTSALQCAASRWQGPGAGAALQSLVELAQQEPATGTLVLEALRSANEELRSVALGLLERSPLVVQAAPGPLVLELLAGSSASVRAPLLRALARVGSKEPGVLPALANALAAAPDDREVRSAIVAALSTAPLPEVLDVAAGLPPGLRSYLLQALVHRPATTADATSGSESARLLRLLDAWLQGPEALPPQQAATFLHQRFFLGARDADSLQVLERLLGHADPQIAAAASQCLNMSPEGIAQRLAMLRSPDLQARRLALKGARTGRGGLASTAEHEILLAALEDPDAEVRAGVARWLATWSGWSHDPATWPAPPERRRALAQAAFDLFRLGQPVDRGLAVYLYVQAQVPRAEMLPLLRGLLGDTSNPVDPTLLGRAFALTAEWVEATVVSSLVEELLAPDMVRRADAALVLASLRQESQRVLEAMPGLLAHPSPRIVQRGVEIARLLGPAAQDAAPALRRLIEADQRDGIGYYAVRALLTVAPEAPETIAALRRWLVDGPRAARWGLPAALAEMGPRGAPLLVEGLGRGSPVAELCMQGLQQMGAAAREALPALRERALKRPDDKALAGLIASLEGG